MLGELRGGDQRQRRSAALQLGQTGHASVRRPLETALGDPDVGVRVGAAAALEALGFTASRRPLEQVLGDADHRVRAQAAFALSRLADRRSAAVLCRCVVSDDSAFVRNASAIALGHIGDPAAIPALERALRDSSDRVRREAILALNRVGDTEVAGKVRPFLQDPAERVRIAAAIVLGSRRDAASAPSIEERLRTSATWEKPALIVALGRIGRPTSVRPLMEASDHPLRSIRVCAIHALTEMRAPIARSIARAKTADRSWAVRGTSALSLGRVGKRTDVPLLERLLRDPHPWPRRGAAFALGMLGARRSAPRLRRLLADTDPEVRLAAIWALGELRDAGAARPLAELLRTTRPVPRIPGVTIAKGEGAITLVSDADSRLFDALVDAVGAIGTRGKVRSVLALLSETERSLTEEELGRTARLPTPVGSGEVSGITVRDLFERYRT